MWGRLRSDNSRAQHQVISYLALLPRDFKIVRFNTKTYSKCWKTTYCKFPVCAFLKTLSHWDYRESVLTTFESQYTRIHKSKGEQGELKSLDLIWFRLDWIRLQWASRQLLASLAVRRAGESRCGKRGGEVLGGNRYANEILQIAPSCIQVRGVRRSGVGGERGGGTLFTLPLDSPPSHTYKSWRLYPRQVGFAEQCKLKTQLRPEFPVRNTISDSASIGVFDK